MVNRTDTSVFTTETAADTALSYIHQRTASSARSPQQDTMRFDELFRSLTDARENRRARQVFEWELARRRNSPIIA